MVEPRFEFRSLCHAPSPSSYIKRKTQGEAGRRANQGEGTGDKVRTLETDGTSIQKAEAEGSSPAEDIERRCPGGTRNLVLNPPRAAAPQRRSVPVNDILASVFTQQLSGEEEVG